MTHVLQILSQILNPEKYVQGTNSVLTVVEQHRQASLKSINIVSVGQNALALKLDECGFPGNNVFVVQHKMHRACDAVAFCTVGDESYILCCELKSSEPSRHEVTEQFQSAQCFLSYLDSLLATYHNLTIAHWPRRYFVFHDAAKNPLSKAPLVDTTKNDIPERAQILPVQNGARIYLRKLLGKPL
ncbi:MAG: hypothetical protein Q8K59_07740 [Nitrosomonas sp.]|nr:hypothetical protein [Nitrosomonas sp.]MDP1950970.1 hypothetical protein [Nitrosomonas sp.]